MPMQIPPLRERKEDIPILATHILAKRRGAAKTFGGDESAYPTSISTRAMSTLQSYAWPGNIRELENVLSRAAILCDGEIIHTRDLDGVGLPSEGRFGVPAKPVHSGDLATPAVDSSLSLKEQVAHAVAQVERAAITEALSKSRGSVTKAAKALGISRATIYNKLRNYEIEA